MNIKSNQRPSLLAKGLESMTRLPGVAMADVLDMLRREKKEILSLSVGEPDFPTPPHIIEAAVAALRDGDVAYQPVGGTPKLRSAIREKFARDGLNFADEEILVGAGCKQLIFSAFCATINPNDEVVIPAPYWVSYPKLTRLFGGKAVEVQCSQDNHFKITPAQLSAVLTKKTKWFVLNTPGNPGGGVYSREELKALGAVLERFPGCLILSDDIYEHYVYEDNVFVTFAAANPDLVHRTLTVNGPSKTYSMPGLRIGYAAAPVFLAKAITAVIAQDTSCAVSSSLRAATAALTGDQSWLEANRVAYQARRDCLVKNLKKIPEMHCVSPQGAYYAFTSVEKLIGRVTPSGETLKTDADVMRYFLAEAQVKTAAGISYGTSPFLRLSFSTSVEKIERACQALSVAVKALKLRA